MKKRILSTLLALTMGASTLPVTGFAAPEESSGTDNTGTDYSFVMGNPFYRETFEDSNFLDTAKANQKGWTFNPGGGVAFDRGNNFNNVTTGSNMIRFCGTQWDDSSLELNLKQSAIDKGVQETDYDSYINDNVAVSFSYAPTADGSEGNKQDGSRNMIELLAADGKPFMAFEAYTKDKKNDDITLNLIALNDNKTENVRYELAKGASNVFDILRNVTVYMNSADDTYQVKVGSEPLTIGSFGEWIPMSTSDDVGAAAPAENVKIGSVKINNIHSSWYGGIVLDDIELSNWSVLNFTNPASAPEKAMSLWYRKPAEEWAQSIPLGNGRIGAMVWGGVVNDTVSLNDVTAWSGQAQTGLDKDGSSTGYAALKGLQNEMMTDNPDRSLISSYIKEMGGEGNPTTGTHRPFGELSVSFKGMDSTISGYRRSLDMENAVSTVEFASGGTKYMRETLVSNPDDIVAIKYTADGGSGKISFDAALTSDNTNGGEGAMTAGDDYIEYNGAVVNNENVTNGVNTFAYMKAVPEGGTVTYDETGMHVNNADSVVVIVSLGTDFTAGKNFTQNTRADCKAKLDAAVTKGYSDIKNAHTEDVSALFNRMKVEIGAADELKSSKPTDERLADIRNGGEVDGSFMSLWYQYARYLMIAGSRENSPMPMNLQGIWNDGVASSMAWTCDYHLDINTQMNQWMANSANLSESEIPIFNYMKNILIPSGQITAQKQYGVSEAGGGWLAPVASNAWGHTGISKDSWESFTGTTCGAWLAQEIMSYYDHTGDKDFLSGDGFEMLKQTAAFYNEFMVEYTDGNGNKYWVTVPSGSPEHGNCEMMSTIDITVVGDIFDQTMRCYDILDKEHDDFYNSIKTKRESMPSYKIMPNGSLAEWPYRQGTDDENMGVTNHRHTSHLLGIYPYAQITPDKTPELAKAALKSMHLRYDREDFEDTEWTLVNEQGQFARLKDGVNAYKALKTQANTYTWPNLLSISPEGIALAPCDVYCIDGTFGTGAATAEMLLQSHSDRLEFLPALPKEWSEGKIEGMSAEGAMTVDFTWKDYMITSAKITSKNGGAVNILKNAAIRWDDVAVYDGDNKVAITGNDKLLTFTAEAGKTYTLKTDAGEELRTGRIINDDYPGISYNDFGYNSGRDGLNDIANDVHYSERTGASIEFAFNGTGIDVLAEMHKNGGKKVKITIDGEDKGEYANTLQDNAESDYQAHGLVYSIDNLKPGSHTIKIEQIEDGGYFEFDAFAVKGQYFEQINDDDPRITYEDGWQRSTDREKEKGDYMADIHYAEDNAVGKSLTVEFEGTGIETIVEKDSIFGELGFEVDGRDYGKADTSNGKGSHIVNPISGLPNGKHTLKVTHLGKEGTWNWCAIDGFIILNDGGATITTGTFELTNLADNKLLTSNDDTITASSDKGGADSQKWIFSYINDRQFRLISAQSGMAIAVESDMLVQRPSDPTAANQIWEKVDYNTANGDFWLFNEAVSNYTNVYGGNCNDGDSVGMWSNGGQPDSGENNFWKIEDAGNGAVFLRSAKNKTQPAYMTVDPNSAENSGAGVKVYAKRSGSNQTWSIEYDGNEKYTLKQNGKYAARVNDKLTLVDEADNDNAKWTLTQATQNGTLYCVFTNAADGKTLDINGEKWGMKASAETKAAPYVYDITTTGKITKNGKVDVTYKYSGDAENNSDYRVYTVSSGITLYSEGDDGTIASGTTSAEDGFSFNIPEDYSTDKTIIIAITPKASGKTGGTFYKYIRPFEAQDKGLSAGTVKEVIFNDADVKNQQKGFTHSADQDDAEYSVGVQDKLGKEECLNISANNWFKNSRINLNLEDSSNDFSALTGKAYVEFNALFETPNNYDKESRMYIALKDGNQQFAAVRLFSRRLDIMAIDSTGQYRKNYSVAIGADETSGKWFNFKFYVDTDNERFAVKVDNQFITKDGKDIWFTPAQGCTEGYPGNAQRLSIDSVSAIEFGHIWSGAPSTLWVSDLKVGTYGQSDDNSWITDSFAPEDGTLKYGEDNTFNLVVAEKKPVENGIIYTALYKDGVLAAVNKKDNVAFDDRGIYEDTVTLTVPKMGGDYTAKVFLWNENMQPIGGVYETTLNVESKFTVPNVFSDNMMIQADKDITVWGTAAAGDTVTAEFAGDTPVSATVDNDGKWTLTLPAKEASTNGETYTLSVKCGDETKTYSNVIFGDVYLLAGQSNMEAWMGWIESHNMESEKDKSNNPNIRTVDLLSKGNNGDADPQENIPVSDTAWNVMSDSNLSTTSAIGYYFAQELNEKTGRPIGYIHAAVGGTGIARWLQDDYAEGVSGYPWSLYNNRVYPFRNLKLSGVLYYQGEAEGPNGQDSSQGWSAEKYSTVMAKLIDNYRELFGDENLPFYYAQLARYSNQNFELIRAAQVWALDKVANPEYVRMVSNLDEVGNFGASGNTSGNARHDIHPYGKDEVARRFALLAMHDIYGDNTAAFTGPRYKSMEISGNKLILTFNTTGDLKIMPMDQYGDYKTDELIIAGDLNAEILNSFEIAGEDGKYYTATAAINGDKVELTSDDVDSPVNARYAFGAYPESPNLTDESGLPSFTFSTEYTGNTNN